MGESAEMSALHHMQRAVSLQEDFEQQLQQRQVKLEVATLEAYDAKQCLEQQSQQWEAQLRSLRDELERRSRDEDVQKRCVEMDSIVKDVCLQLLPLASFSPGFKESHSTSSLAGHFTNRFLPELYGEAPGSQFYHGFGK